MHVFKNTIIIPTIIPAIDNEHDFTFIREYLLNKPTATDHQIAQE
jgi:hypothetical protein